MLEQAGVSGAVAIVIILLAILSMYTYVRRRARTKSARFGPLTSELSLWLSPNCFNAFFFTTFQGPVRRRPSGRVLRGEEAKVKVQRLKVQTWPTLSGP